MKTSTILIAALLSALGIATAAPAAETVTYSYDAKGRLTKAARSGGSAGGVSDYEHDKANYRRRVKVTGAP